MSGDPEKKLEWFFSNFKYIRYKKKATLIRADDIPTGVYYIEKGYVRYYTLSETGQELSLIIFKPGDFLPVIWAITESLNVLQYCEAMTDVEVYRAPRVEFVDFLQKNPDVLYAVFQKILVRFEGILERIGYMIFGNAYQKVASILVICVERFGRDIDKKNQKRKIISVPLTHKDIAGLIGLTRETTSFEMGKLGKLKIVEKKGKFICVNNIERLKNEARWYKFT